MAKNRFVFVLSLNSLSSTSADLLLLCSHSYKQIFYLHCLMYNGDGISVILINRKTTFDCWDEKQIGKIARPTPPLRSPVQQQLAANVCRFRWAASSRSLHAKIFRAVFTCGLFADLVSKKKSIYYKVFLFAARVSSLTECVNHWIYEPNKFGSKTAMANKFCSEPTDVRSLWRIFVFLCHTSSIRSGLLSMLFISGFSIRFVPPKKFYTNLFELPEIIQIIQKMPSRCNNTSCLFHESFHSSRLLTN